MNDPVARAEARLQRYWNVDGLHEIAVALMFALTALWVWATDLSSLPHSWKGVFSVTFPIMIWTGMWTEKRIIGAIRKRLTYPRAGYVAFRKPPLRRHIAATVAGALVTAGIAVLAVRDQSGDLRRMAAAAGGLAVGVAACFFGWHSRMPRFFVIGVFLATLGVAIPLSGLDFSHGMVLYWLLACAILLVSGGVTLWRFLRATPVAEAE